MTYFLDESPYNKSLKEYFQLKNEFLYNKKTTSLKVDANYPLILKAIDTFEHKDTYGLILLLQNHLTS